VISGGNQGNTIQVAGGDCNVTAAPAKPGGTSKPGGWAKPGGTVKPGKATKPGKTVVVSSPKVKPVKVRAVPSTGVAETGNALAGLLALGGSMAAGVLGLRRRQD
jgi:hypothetical protein